jgi:hypothetical protein
LERIKIFSESIKKFEELKEKFKDEVFKKNIEFEFSKKKEFKKLSKKQKFTGTIAAHNLFFFGKSGKNTKK